MSSSCFIGQDIPKRGKQKIQRDMRTGKMDIEVGELHTYTANYD